MISFCHYNHDSRLTFKFDKNYHVRQNGQVCWEEGGRFKAASDDPWNRDTLLEEKRSPFSEEPQGQQRVQTRKSSGSIDRVSSPPPLLSTSSCGTLLWSVIGCELNSIRSAVRWRFVWLLISRDKNSPTNFIWGRSIAVTQMYIGCKKNKQVVRDRFHTRRPYWIVLARLNSPRDSMTIIDGVVSTGYPRSEIVRRHFFRKRTEEFLLAGSRKLNRQRIISSEMKSGTIYKGENIIAYV